MPKTKQRKQKTSAELEDWVNIQRSCWEESMDMCPDETEDDFYYFAKTESGQLTAKEWEQVKNML